MLNLTPDFFVCEDCGILFDVVKFDFVPDYSRLFFSVAK